MRRLVVRPGACNETVISALAHAKRLGSKQQVLCSPLSLRGGGLPVGPLTVIIIIIIIITMTIIIITIINKQSITTILITIPITIIIILLLLLLILLLLLLLIIITIIIIIIIITRGGPPVGPLAGDDAAEVRGGLAGTFHVMSCLCVFMFMVVLCIYIYIYTQRSLRAVRLIFLEPALIFKYRLF